MQKPGEYASRSSRDFERKLARFKKSDPGGYSHIVKTMERLLTEPGDSDGMMTGPHHGKLKKYVGRSGYRIIYKWCRECKKMRLKDPVNCPFCDSIPDNSVVFLDLFRKNDASKLNY